MYHKFNNYELLFFFSWRGECGGTEAVRHVIVYVSEQLDQTDN